MKRAKLGSFDFLIGERKKITKFILDKIDSNEGFILLPTSLNDLASVSDNSSLVKNYGRIDFCVTDGMPLAWFFKTERIYGPDLMKDILQFGNRELRHSFYGSSRQTLDSLEKNISIFYPKTKVLKTISPPFKKLTLLEEGRFLAEIINTNPNVLWIGLSSPKQVVFATRWKKFLPHSAIICVGAGFDFLAKKQPTAPKLVQNMGLEWFFRLLVNPRRLWKRYLIKIPKFILKKILIDRFI